MESTQITDLFSFDPDYIYQFTLITGQTMSGKVIEVYDNGIVLDNLAHIPQTAIVLFTPLSVKINETTPDFMV